MDGVDEMGKILIALALMFLSLSARENPFFPSKGEVDISYTTNLESKLIPLKRAAVSFPSTARTIESVTVKYKNLDGSIKEKSIVLGNSIDWHLPLFISQNYAQGDGVKANLLQSKRLKFVKIAGLKFISLYEAKKRLKIITKDVMLRNFLLVKPHRIVCDFKREIDIRSYEKNIMQKSIVKKIKIGNHLGYYRVVIELDGFYTYEVKKLSNGYSFHFL